MSSARCETEVRDEIVQYIKDEKDRAAHHADGRLQTLIIPYGTHGFLR